MLPVKKIITTTDFSEPSLTGVLTAVELAQPFNAELILVHVIRPLQTVSGAATFAGYHRPKTDKEITDKATELANQVIRENIPEAVQRGARILHGKPAQEIAKLSKKEGADLIVIASRGESGWKHALFGSVAESVVRNAACPVLIVPRPPSSE